MPAGLRGEGKETFRPQTGLVGSLRVASLGDLQCIGQICGCIITPPLALYARDWKRLIGGLGNRETIGQIMHYYQFHIGDYASHTAHLNELEDLAYRRLLDLYYLHESPLPDDVEHLAKLIRMRMHCTCIADVLHEFFECTAGGWIHHRADAEIAKAQGKSAHGKKAAKVRWAKYHAGLRGDADAEQMQCAGNADAMPPKTQDPRPTTHNNSANATRFRPPSIDEVRAYCLEKGYTLDPEHFVNFYESKGWMVGKNKMKKWKAAVANWEKKNREESQRTGDKQSRSANLKHETFHGDF